MFSSYVTAVLKPYMALSSGFADTFSKQTLEKKLVKILIDNFIRLHQPLVQVALEIGSSDLKFVFRNISDQSNFTVKS